MIYLQDLGRYAHKLLLVARHNVHEWLKRQEEFQRNRKGL